MPKPLFGRPQEQAQSILSATQSQRESRHQQPQGPELDRLLRKPRSKAYMDAMTKLDAGGHAHNKEKVDEIMNAIRNEFPETEIGGILLGVVSLCYLGEPYEVHTLDFTGCIIEHFPKGRPLPGIMENARGLALHGGYSFIEVYVDCLRCVSSAGAVSVVKI